MKVVGGSGQPGGKCSLTLCQPLEDNRTVRLQPEASPACSCVEGSDVGQPQASGSELGQAVAVGSSSLGGAPPHRWPRHQEVVAPILWLVSDRGCPDGGGRAAPWAGQGAHSTQSAENPGEEFQHFCTLEPASQWVAPKRERQSGMTAWRVLRRGVWGQLWSAQRVHGWHCAADGASLRPVSPAGRSRTVSPAALQGPGHG